MSQMSISVFHRVDDETFKEWKEAEQPLLLEAYRYRISADLIRLGQIRIPRGTVEVRHR